MGLRQELYRRIKQEILTDPEGLGYAGKTDAEIMDMLNTPVTKQRVVTDTFSPPITRILAGLEGASNIISETEVTEARNS